jgi:predicted phosphodiesterase
MSSTSFARRQFLAAGAVWLSSAWADRTRVQVEAPRPRTPTMRRAALFDIHGNLPALDAVLQDVRRAKVDEVIVGGDVFPGPMPFLALARLRALDIPVRFLKGNGDRVVLEAKTGGDISEVPGPYRNVIQWAAQSLSDADYTEIVAWPRTLRLRADRVGEMLFCHATPRSDTEIFTRRTLESRLLPVFEGVNVGLVVCGHTHMQFDRMVGPTRVVNAGSVGMPFGEPGAYWLLVGPDVQLRRTTYDLSRAAARVRETDYPQAEEFATQSILNPPSEEQMLTAYSRLELR